jgi:serine/threonine protein phosphatase PrpC
MEINSFVKSIGDNPNELHKYVITILNLDKSGKAYYNGVYDGKGGILLVNIIESFLHLYIEKQLQNIDLTNENSVKNVINECFKNLHFCIYKHIDKLDVSTTTISIMIYFELVNKLYLINLGNSKSVVWDGDKITTTIEDKPGRVFGRNTNIIPDIKIINLDKNYYKFIVATNGLWNVQPNDIIKSIEIQEYKSLENDTKNSKDNITVIIGELTKKYVSPIPGLYYFDNLISADYAKQLVEYLDNKEKSKWEPVGSGANSRLVQQYGYIYDYKQRNHEKLGIVDSNYTFNQLIVNNYLHGQDIAKHTDLKTYGPVIGCYTIGSGGTTRFKNKDGRIVDLYVKANSLYIMSGESRYEWTHEMPSTKTDMYNGKRINRDRRVSITFRNVP